MEKIVTVTGAGGQIGYSLLFRLASGEVFGPNVKVRLRLVELERGLPALEGLAMELWDCGFPTLQEVVCTADLAKGMDGTHWALLVGSVPRKAGMERSDLLSINGQIFKSQGSIINQYADRSAHVLVVGNPCNTNALIAMSHAPDLPRSQFLAMTMLDEKRARAQLAFKANVNVGEVKHLGIWGNHSATQFPDFAHATISGKPVPQVIHDQAWLENTFISTVQQRGAEVIKARGASSAASAANGVLETMKQVSALNTPRDECFSVAVCSEGQYGIQKGLIFSYPCRMVDGKLRVIEGIEHNAFAQTKIKATEAELISEKQAVKELGLIES